MVNAGLCLPVDDAFNEWLSGIPEFSADADCTGEPEPPASTDDRDALVALYNATDGPNWTNNTNWLSDRPIGEWYGVTTDAYGRITTCPLSITD